MDGAIPGVVFDADSDILTIDGIRYHRDLFRRFGIGPDRERLLRIVGKHDGVITFQCIRDRELSHLFDLVVRAEEAKDVEKRK
jgi:hypothetical protein